VLASATKKRARQVQGMDAWGLLRAIAAAPTELITEPERAQGPCQQSAVPRRGGTAQHNAYADRVTGNTTDFWVKTPEGLEANFDGQDATNAKIVWEVKTRHDWATEAGISSGAIFSPYIHKHRIFKLEEQRARFTAVARRCGFEFHYGVEDEDLAKFLRNHWGNNPVVHHIP
jgi:hypothetical protein